MVHVARALAFCTVVCLLAAQTIIQAGAASAAGILLQYGSRNAYVTLLQEYLDCSSRGDFFGYYAYTGSFGFVTKKALIGWQMSVGSPADGALTLGNNEWDRLKREAISSRCSTGIDVRSRYYSDRDGYAVDISKRDRKVRILHEGEVTLEADGRFGDARGLDYLTREGAFRMFRKEGADYISSLYDVPMPYPTFFSAGQATHYSADFAENGYDGASHGCVNMRSMSAAKAVNDLPLETVFVVH